MIELAFTPGPPPDNYYGVALCILDATALQEHFGPEESEYYGTPVAVMWWGHKGKATLGQKRIEPDMVTHHLLVIPTLPVNQGLT